VNNYNTWIRISKRYVDVESQNMEAMMRERRPLTLYSIAV
jgi:hypothetical protein